MEIFTVVTHDMDAMPNEDRVELISFKNRSSAIEYLVDYLVDEGYVEQDEVELCQKTLNRTGAWKDMSNDKEFYIVAHELCDW